MYQFLCLLLQKNRLFDCTYAEPYAGGAGLALSLLMQEIAIDVHLNDIDPAVYAFWHSVLNDTDAFLQKLHDTPVTMEEWYRQKEMQNHRADVSLLNLGFSTFFLNRTNRSGILNGGVIGGKDQTGNWKIDARYNKKDLATRIKRIKVYSNRIHIYNLDAEQFILQVASNLPKKHLLYLDPPYVKKGKELYTNYYTEGDHARLARLMTDKMDGRNWLVSYDNHPVLRGYYQQMSFITYGLKYSVCERYQGTEIMFFSNSVLLPDIAEINRCSFMHDIEVGSPIGSAA